MEFFNQFLDAPVFLYVEIVSSLVLLLLAAQSRAPNGALSTDPEIEKLAKKVSGVLWKIAAAGLWTVWLISNPKEGPAEWVAFFFAEAISIVLIAMMLSEATQYAILGVLRGYRAPERALEEMRSLSPYRLVFWYNSTSILLRLPFADVPQELKQQNQWKQISLDAQNRILDRELGKHRSKFTKKADKYDPIAMRAYMRVGEARIKSVCLGLGLALVGCLATAFLLNTW
ncbi:hypothetical protein [Sulfitobacter geojensis]|uniref:Uncharacterized protein n=1 Tax=Sulfitobacter geojensis TaxID=1342299 RepID=A0AAE3B637_9RHOB|nr:hypothetical protein [Sulfitobacter geojensis]MBM1689283.1 hypothetical protein [Sulfitobacter geojensis]MBM1693349.1 hypothetical protein [Sulfitobacter geojensis]MBM1705515.1 hypothetical protein [Sulfitobacter geojensis]MBM1709573.1 hypothetical protein [Sulfitobacter geojensis]MBM1713639.1 hypothetical protein [Sulfitobacter geojensis]